MRAKEEIRALPKVKFSGLKGHDSVLPSFSLQILVFTKIPLTEPLQIVSELISTLHSSKPLQEMAAQWENPLFSEVGEGDYDDLEIESEDDIEAPPTEFDLSKVDQGVAVVGKVKKDPRPPRTTKSLLHAEREDYEWKNISVTEEMKVAVSKGGGQ